MVSNIRSAPFPIYIEGIAKDKLVLCDMIADTVDFGTVYFNEQAGANIISFANTQHILSHDMKRNKSGKVVAFESTNKSSGRRHSFTLRDGGLYAHNGVRVTSRSYVSTVRKNKESFSKREVRQAERALLLRQRLNYPSIAEFKRIVLNATMKDLDITTKDIDNMESIFGVQYADIAGKATYHPTPTPNPDNIASAAATYASKLKDEPLTLHGDVFFVDRMPFLLTVSKPLNYVVCTYLKNRTWTNILAGLEQHKNVYTANGWSVGKLRFDREKGVTCIRELLQSKLHITLDTSAPYQKVPVAERKIRLVKERMRCEICNLGYSINRTMLAHLPRYVCRRLNCCTSRIVSINVSPHELLTGQRVSAKQELKIGFGEYAYVYSVDGGAPNKADPRSRVCVCLGLSNNQEASAVFYDLGKPLSQIPRIADNYKVAPIPDQVVEYMNELAKEKLVVFDEETMSIRDDTAATAVEIDATGDASDNTPESVLLPLPAVDVPDADYHPQTQTAEQVLIVVDDQLPLSPDFMDDLNIDDPNFDFHEEHEDDMEIIKIIDSMVLRDEGTSSHNPMQSNPTVTDGANEFITSILENITKEDTSPSPEIRDDMSSRRMTTRSTTRKSHVTKMIYCANKVETSSVTAHKNYNISMKKGIEKYGDAARLSVAAELEAMEKKQVFTPMHHQDVTPKQRAGSIRSFIFLKEKLNPDGTFNKLKSRLTANGKTQNREEVEMLFGNTSSPTISFSSLMSLIAIAKSEGRKIATADIKNAYLNADLSSEGLIVMLDATVTKEYIKIRPDAAGLVNHKGELYCALNKALYGTVEGAKAWYDDISGYLLDLGFQKNSYDQCVFNAVFDDVQISVGVYVDDLFITCVDEEIIQHLKDMLVDKYKELNFDDKLKLNYLGMIIDNTNDEHIDISMPSYVQSIIDEIGTKQGETSDTPAAMNLFSINESDKPLEEKAKEDFHTTVAKILYLSKHARPDILLAATFLCTRVQCPGAEDLKKLRRVGRYLNKTKELTLRIKRDSNIIGPDGNVVNINVFVDASFAVHDTMRSHTGAIISVGDTPVFYKSTKQKLNASSSTQAEIIAISDILPQTIATAGFIHEQMNKVVFTTVHEDNMSTIAMLKNGRPKAENTRHINIRYFHICDYVEKGEIEVVYVNTDNQHGDFYTKPLQGIAFDRHCEYIMGHAGDM